MNCLFCGQPENPTSSSGTCGSDACERAADEAVDHELERDLTGERYVEHKEGRNDENVVVHQDGLLDRLLDRLPEDQTRHASPPRALIHILDAWSRSYTMLYVRISQHNGRWCVSEGLTNR